MLGHREGLKPSKYVHPPLHYYYPHPHPNPYNHWIYNYPVEGAGTRETFALASGLAEIHHTHDKLFVKLDVRNFSPDELVVKTVDEFLIIEGNHEEKQDEHGFITRSFKRRFHLPDEVDKEDLQLECEIGVDGVLKVTVPKKVFAVKDENATIHPIKKISA